MTSLRTRTVNLREGTRVARFKKGSPIKREHKSKTKSILRIAKLDHLTVVNQQVLVDSIRRNLTVKKAILPRKCFRVFPNSLKRKSKKTWPVNLRRHQSFTMKVSKTRYIQAHPPTKTIRSKNEKMRLKTDGKCCRKSSRKKHRKVGFRGQ